MQTTNRCRRPMNWVVAFIFVFSWSSESEGQMADLVLLNGNIMTMDEARPSVEAIAIAKDRIIAVGTNAQLKKYIRDETQIVDLDGKFAMPGLIEGHGHFVGLGQSMMMLNLAGANSWEEIVDLVAEATKVVPPGQWIVGRGWHQSKWSQPPQPNVQGYPTSASISKRTPNHPVLLTHASGHMNFANDYAMRQAGVDANTESPAGGEILKNEAGRPIGVFRETAQGLITSGKRRDERSKTEMQVSADLRKAIELASEACLRNGITSFQDAGSSFETVDLLRDLALAGQLNVRLYVMIRESNDRLEAKLKNYKMIGLGNEFLTVRALKRSIDGALGPHGAWLLAPYSDLPGSSGLNTASVESVTRTAELALEHDFQMCVHAIGDRANREVLDIFESLFKQSPSNLPRRWRIEHAQHLNPVDIPRFASMNIIASMQAVHCTSDAVFVPKRLGMRRSQEGAYVWRSLIDSGAVVTNGTDAPVESINPIDSIYASVTRQLTDGVTFFPAQAMTRKEALRSYTIDCAYAAFEETSKGSLVAGKLADIVVLSNDLLNCPPEEIKTTKVLTTIVAGKIVYQASENEQRND
jgi:predicted amidohydrolase YtcJ